MGKQGNPGDGVRQLCEWIWNGEIGEVKRSTRMDQPSDLAARITAPNRKTTLSEDDELGLIYRPGRHASVP